LQKVNKTSSSRPSENYNDPSSYSASTVDPLVIQNDNLRRQLEHAQLLQSNKDLLKQLERVNKSSHSKKHRKRKKRDDDTESDASECSNEKKKKKKSRKHSSHSSKYDDSALDEAQKSLDDID